MSKASPQSANRKAPPNPSHLHPIRHSRPSQSRNKFTPRSVLASDASWRLSMQRMALGFTAIVLSLISRGASAQTPAGTDLAAKPLRVAMAGLAHGHASGFLQHI